MKFYLTLLIFIHAITITISTNTSYDDSYLYSFVQTTLQPKQQKQQNQNNNRQKQRMKQKRNQQKIQMPIPNEQEQRHQPYEKMEEQLQQKQQSNLRGTIEIPTVNGTTFSFDILYPDSLSPSSAPTTSSEIDFNYDPYSPIGPNHWDTIVNVPTTYKDYITENENQCSSSSSSTTTSSAQSPINIKNSMLLNYPCTDNHPPKVHIGQTKFKELDFVILPNALRVKFPQNNIPVPKIDFSDLSTPIKLLHVDVKIRSEHYLNGQQYPGEFQMYFHFPKSADEFKQHTEDQLVALSIFMDFHDDDSNEEENKELEQFIKRWEEELWSKQNECKRRIDPTIPEYAPTYYTVYTKKETNDIWDLPKVVNANSTLRTDFNIWRFMPTGYYCGYKGSLTEPPCTDKVTWRILDLPMKISKAQYKRMQSILTNRLDDTTCEITTASYNGTVNRPLQYEDKILQKDNEVLQEGRNINTAKPRSFCCNAYNWPFSDVNDPQYWLESWPLDYHGWQGTTVATYKSFFDLFGGGQP